MDKENHNLEHEQINENYQKPKQKVNSFIGINKAESSMDISVSSVNNELTKIKVEDSGIEDSSTVDSGFDDNSCGSSVLTLAMLEEERKLKIELQNDQEKQRKEYEKQKRQQEKEEHEKVIKEMRYKRLMNLLEKSQFYARFLNLKVTKMLDDQNKRESKHAGKRKKGDLHDFTEDIISACKKVKTEEGGFLKASNKSKNENIDSTSSSSYSDKTKSSSSTSANEEENTIVTALGIKVSARQPKLLEGAALRDYQLDGLNWLKILFESGMNGILADEMGLGKTIQVISFICHLYEVGVAGPFLVVGPLSTLPNWIIEFSRFAPQLQVILYHGNENERIKLRRSVSKKYPLLDQKALPVILTSYEIPVRDKSFLSTIQWKYIIVDEGHRLKNYKSLLSRTLSSFNSINRLLLTGTPLQNDLTELWSLLHFLLPDIFDRLDVFQSWFEIEDIERDDIADVLVEQEKKNRILTTLHKILTPFLLRREKSGVNLNIPPKKEVLVYCPMSNIQRKLYEAILDRSIITMMKPEESLIIEDNADGTKVKRRSALRKVDTNSFQEKSKEPENDILLLESGMDQYILKPKVSNPQMALRKTINHPYLINMPVLPGSSILRVDEGLVSDSGKFTILDGLLSRLKKRNHKVILFSTFTTILDLLEELMEMRNYDYERLDGGTKLEFRKKSIHRFNTEENAFIFLISTRAGGLGINLTSADTAIIFDSDWNPQADLQAQDRCHRIGQIRPVVVYRFITEGSIDEKIYSRATAKRKLEKLVIHKGNFNNSIKAKQPDNIDLEELKELLRSKPNCRELRTDGSALSEKEWNKLLDRSDLFEGMKTKEMT